ncbi:zona pellucida-like domain protein [Ancylostoma ceylanicum]|uniref:Zona pellucida-like domain protein n=1 Tax=Ancylostoma ceylanicum TaxID=53326 RepID=A0A0D6LY80_9BILA|nr:zona pellucida-like domain protein [Ancylostoma ceylanicum]
MFFDGSGQICLKHQMISAWPRQHDRRGELRGAAEHGLESVVTQLGPEQRGVEQSITIIISFHSTFITKVDRAYRCTCFYMEADKVVTSKFDVSVLPTTDLIDTARMPLCTYTVRRDSISGPIVQFAQVGEPVFHVWQCESDMFSMLVHSCFVDDSNGQDRKPFLDEHGCAIDPVIVPDLTYNKENNLAFAQITTYFQCAVSTCMVSEGMCEGKTPPRCGPVSQHFRLVRSASEVRNSTRSSWVHLDNTMDLSAQKITVLDLEETPSGEDSGSQSARLQLGPAFIRKVHSDAVCVSSHTAAFLTTMGTGSTLIAAIFTVYLIMRYKKEKSFKAQMH